MILGEFCISRYSSMSDSTMGKMFYPDGNQHGWILEDRIRPDGEYIFGETAIPHGRYRMIITFSNRFQKRMIQLVNVRGSDILFGGKPIDACGIRIHGGNTIKDTEGCPLNGSQHDDVARRVWDCAETVESLFDLVDRMNQTQEVYINIENDFNGIDESLNVSA